MLYIFGYLVFMMAAILNFALDWLKCDYVISYGPIFKKIGVHMCPYIHYIVLKFEMDIWFILVFIGIYAK